jgi:hypothetical protein
MSQWMRELLIEPNNWFLFPFLKIIFRRDAFLSFCVFFCRLYMRVQFGLI